jgi:hypothetical protein
MPFRSSLLAAGLGALVLAGCGSENAALIPQNDADQLTALVAEAGDASAAGDCARAARAVTEAERQLSGLPRKTDARLKQNLKDWLDHLAGRIESDCEEPEPDETATPSPTDATPTPSPTPTETATPVPTETATPEPTATIDPGTGGEATPEEPSGTGGVPPEEG